MDEWLFVFNFLHQNKKKGLLQHYTGNRGFELWSLTSLSTIFQLYRSDKQNLSQIQNILYREVDILKTIKSGPLPGIFNGGLRISWHDMVVQQGFKILTFKS